MGLMLLGAAALVAWGAAESAKAEEESAKTFQSGNDLLKACESAPAQTF